MLLSHAQMQYGPRHYKMVSTSRFCISAWSNWNVFICNMTCIINIVSYITVIATTGIVAQLGQSRGWSLTTKLFKNHLNINWILFKNILNGGLVIKRLVSILNYRWHHIPSFDDAFKTYAVDSYFKCFSKYQFIT